MPTFIPFEFPKSTDGEYVAALTDDRILLNRRTRLGLTQRQVAEMAGVPIRQYQRLESGETEISKTTARVALSVCAVLLLDPYEMIRTRAVQPDPESLRPQESFDAPLSELDSSKHVGRKPIRRDIMTIYFNHPFYSIMITKEVLEKLEKPSFIELRWNKKRRHLVFSSTDGEHRNAYDVPDLIYNTECSALVFPSTDLFDDTKLSLGWDDSVYAAECRLVNDKNGENHILCDLNTAKPSQSITRMHIAKLNGRLCGANGHKCGAIGR